MGRATICLLLLTTACTPLPGAPQDGTGATSGPGPNSGEPRPTSGQPSPGDTTDTGADDTDAPMSDLPDPSAADGEPPTGEPWPPAPAPVVSELSRFDFMDLGEVDGDGRLDLVTADLGAPPRVTFYPGDGAGGFVGDAAVVSEIFAFTGFVLADVTGDGLADVLARGTGQPPRVSVYAATGAGAFAELATTEVFTFTQMHAADIDGDGHADLVTGTGDGAPPRVTVWRGGPDGVADTPLLTAEVFTYTALRAGDLDGDGLVDIATAGAGAPPRINLYPGDGLGGLAQPVVHALKHFVAFDLGDLDGDGRGDVVTDVPGNAWVFALYRSAPGRWDAPVLLDGFNFVGFELGDLDADGRADIVARPTGEPPRVEVYLAPL